MAKHSLPEWQKAVVRTRAQNCCEYCLNQARFAMAPFAVDHIVPEARGGTSTLDNLALACPHCNGSKYAKLHGTDPMTGEPAALFNPRLQLWEEHFAWDDTLTRVIGLTPTGRATVDALYLNREEAVNLRRVLAALGEHPPKASAQS